MDKRDKALQQMVVDQKKILEKAAAANTEEELSNNEEAVLAVLEAWTTAALTAKIVKESKLGKLVAQLSTKYASKAPGLTAKSLLSSWKQLIVASSSSSSSSASSKNSSSTTEQTSSSLSSPAAAPAVPEPTNTPTAAPTVVVTAPTPAPAPTPTDSQSKEKMNLSIKIAKSDTVESLPGARVAMIKIFTNALNSSTNDAKAEALAREIEKSLDIAFPHTSKNYASKAKTLSFNLKKNESLQSAVIRGDISAHDLVNLSAADLASKEQQAKREVITDELAQSRRSDWLETHKKDIQMDIGLDPGNEWEYDEADEVESQPDCDPPDI